MDDVKLKCDYIMKVPSLIAVNFQKSPLLQK